MSTKIDKNVINPLAGFLKSYIYPFATCFFAILNYTKMRDVLAVENNHPKWAIFALILSIIYVLFTLGFAIFWIIHPSPAK